ncbi:MAG: ATP-grasp domain-containing protein [Candidatus Pacearchaeota archaeon]|jgi:hypothetical protein
MRDNSLAYWFPILKDLGINVPKTLIINVDDYDKNCVPALKKMFWMEEMTKEDQKSLSQFIATMEMFATKAGCPLFLRSGQTSNKHDWLDSCYVQDPLKIASHIQSIAEHSCMANMEGGWPINIWVLRKLIPTEPIFTAFNGFPVTREFRIFIRDGKVECVHPYWPREAVEGQTEDKDWAVKLKAMNRLTKSEKEELVRLSTLIASKFEGWWSLDWLQGKDKKWYAIDMALGEDSYHFPKCKYI